jgi:hypothetical protein
VPEHFRLHSERSLSDSLSRIDDKLFGCVFPFLFIRMFIVTLFRYSHKMNGTASPNRKVPKLVIGPRLSVQRDSVFLLLKQV